MGEYINSQNAQFDKSKVSCGLVEMHHLPKQKPLKTLFSLANHLYNKANPRPSAFCLFSDVVGNEEKGRGESLAKAIEELVVAGDLISTKKEVNPKTGSIIKVWLLHINHETFRKWYMEELANALDND